MKNYKEIDRAKKKIISKCLTSESTSKFFYKKTIGLTFYSMPNSFPK